MGYGLTLKEVILLSCSGLRGAVTLVLLLLIDSNSNISSEIHEKMSFYVSGIVCLTMFVNGISIECLYRFLGISNPNEFHKLVFSKALYELEERSISLVASKYADNPFYKTVRWKVGDTHLTPGR
jgi:NhaP-type Na+/H+ and K+/H+ antiporter